MAVNKVDYFGNTLIDISDSTVSPSNLLDGTVAYNAAGEKIIGAVVTAPIDSTLTISGAAADAKVVGDRLGGSNNVRFEIIGGEPYIIYDE